MLKKLYSARTIAILLFFTLLIQHVHAQESIAKTAKDAANTLIDKNAAAIKLSAEDRANTRVSDAYYSNQSGLLIVYLQQTYKDIDVYNSLKVLAFKNDKLVSATGSIIANMALKANNPAGAPSLRPEGAVGAAARHLNLPLATSLKPLQFNGDGKQAAFDGLGIASDSIKTKLLWMPVDNGQRLVLCWQVEIQPLKSANYWFVRVDAKDGTIVNKDNLTLSCNWHKTAHVHTAECFEIQRYNNTAAAPEVTAFKDPAAINSAKYRVIPFPAEAPSFPGGAPALVTNPWLLAPAGSPATSLKWNDNGSTDFAITRGNNVYAQEDHDANDNTLGAPGKSKTPLPDLEFDYQPDFYGEPQDSLNQGFSLTNLFYWNNIMHDISYQYGFDEVSGNFQQDNQGRGGKGSDYVVADGQDAVDVDNSNFGTLPDGQKPRMQMFLFDFVDGLICLVNTPGEYKGYKAAVEGDLSVRNHLSAKGPVTADVVLYKGAGGSNSGCGAATNAAALKSNIALIYRGGCDFVVKIKNAQNAGAIGVIMVDTVPNEIVTMAGSDNSITIPAIMITLADGNTIKNYLNSGTTVNITLKAGHLFDGSLDAGVMCHEYTHGISNRLTGGPANVSCLFNAEQMGEGWSDYYALMVTTDWSKAALTDGTKKRPLGTYVLGELPSGPGIREYPYSTDIKVDRWTYAMLKSNTSGGEVHLVGEIWCTALWEMTWNIIQQDNLINPHLYDATKNGGNTVALKLVTEAMKLQPCSPGFIDGRDAILKADTILYNGKYSCAIWKAFAKRGMGVNALQGSSNSTTDQVADFSIPATPLLHKRVDKDTAAQGATLTYTITSTCSCTPVSNVKIVDTLAPSVTYVSGGTYNNANRTITFSGINLAASATASFTAKVKINSGTYFAPVNVFTDSVNASTIPTAVWQNQSATGTTWAVSTKHKTGSFSYFAYDSSKKTTESLITKTPHKLSGASTLSFWHLYDTEEGFDGGVVELSSDNGVSWIDLGPYITQNGYNKTISKTSVSALAGRQVFSGSSGSFINTLVNLSTFAGQKVMIRFTFATDNINKGVGWFIDDITIKSRALVYNKIQLFTAADSLESSADTVTAISNILPVTWGSFTAEKLNGGAHLAWKTLTELNTDRYIVERSPDGAMFFEIGYVQAAGNSNFAINYQFNDGKPLQGLNYYRIKQVDKDGKFDYSAVRSLTFDNHNGFVGVSPNPARGKVGVTVTGNTKPLKVYLLNNLGQQLQVYNMGGQFMQLNLTTVAAGVYYVRIEGEGVSSQHKLIVK